MGNHKTRIHAPLDSDEYTFYNEIAQANPFRYRSYYFDTETGFYYLPARYYDPAIGRFLSQDDHSYLDPETVNGLNLYAYCLNNPVMNVDPSGHSVFYNLLIDDMLFRGEQWSTEKYYADVVIRGITYGFENWKSFYRGLLKGIYYKTNVVA